MGVSLGHDWLVMMLLCWLTSNAGQHFLNLYQIGILQVMWEGQTMDVDDIHIRGVISLEYDCLVSEVVTLLTTEWYASF